MLSCFIKIMHHYKTMSTTNMEQGVDTYLRIGVHVESNCLLVLVLHIPSLLRHLCGSIKF